MKIIQQDFDPAIPVEVLQEHPDNPRRGDTKAVAESVDSNGFYGAILVQKSTNRVLAGHTRLRVAREQGATSVPGIWIDVDDRIARRILLADNRTSDLAYYDDDALFRILAEAMDETGNLKGTGYDDATYRLLLGSEESEDDLYVGNVKQSLTPAERAAIYEASDIRSIILPYAGETYDEVVEMLSALRSERDLKTNAEVVLAILRDSTS